MTVTTQHPAAVAEILSVIHELKRFTAFWYDSVLHVYGRTAYSAYPVARKMVAEVAEWLAARGFRIMAVGGAPLGNAWTLQAIPHSVWLALNKGEPWPREWSVDRCFDFRETVVAEVNRLWESTYRLAVESEDDQQAARRAPATG